MTTRLAERGDEVVALVRDVAKAREALPPGVELAAGDVTDPESVRRAMEGADGVFNCMGLFEQWFRRPGHLRARERRGGAQRDRGRARGRREAERSTPPPSTSSTPRPGGTVSEAALADYPKGTAYERSKQHAEELVLAEAAAGIEVVIVNPSSVYGAGPWQGAGLDRAFRDADPPAPPGRPARRDDARPLSTTWPRASSPRSNGGSPASATSSRTATRPCGRSSPYCGRRSRAGMGASDPAGPTCPGTGHGRRGSCRA